MLCASFKLQARMRIWIWMDEDCRLMDCRLDEHWYNPHLVGWGLYWLPSFCTISYVELLSWFLCVYIVLALLWFVRKLYPITRPDVKSFSCLSCFVYEVSWSVWGHAPKQPNAASYFVPVFIRPPSGYPPGKRQFRYSRPADFIPFWMPPSGRYHNLCGLCCTIWQLVGLHPFTPLSCTETHDQKTLSWYSGLWQHSMDELSIP